MKKLHLLFLVCISIHTVLIYAADPSPSPRLAVSVDLFMVLLTSCVASQPPKFNWLFMDPYEDGLVRISVVGVEVVHYMIKIEGGLMAFL